MQPIEPTPRVPLRADRIIRGFALSDLDNDGATGKATIFQVYVAYRLAAKEVYADKYDEWKCSGALHESALTFGFHEGVYPLSDAGEQGNRIAYYGCMDKAEVWS